MKDPMNQFTKNIALSSMNSARFSMNYDFLPCSSNKKCVQKNLKYSAQVSFMVFLNPLATPIYANCMENSSLNIHKNISFCVLQPK